MPTKKVDPRTQTTWVKAYLNALSSPQRPTGRRTRPWLEEQVATLPERIHEEPDALQRVILTQRLMDA
jgi:hypothetical protein